MNTKRKGFTVIEAMVAIAAAAILMATISLILVAGFRTWNSANVYVQLRRDASLAISLMTRDIREADPADISLTATSITIEGDPLPYRAVYSWDSTSEELSYTRDGASLFPTFAENISSFLVQVSTNPTLVEIQLEMQAAALGGDRITFTNRTVVHTRNPF